MTPAKKIIIDDHSFRKALGSFASGVVVVSTLNPASRAPVGVTVSAFSSLSLDPPLVLFCLGLKSSNLDSYRQFGHFAINILSAEQRELSNRFASRSEDKWTGVAWNEGESGVPLIDGCLANLECSLVDARDGGDHVIIIGRVEQMKIQEGGSPLVYYRGGYMDL